MAFTRTWGDLITMVKAQVRNVPASSDATLAPMYCDFVSSRMSQIAAWDPQRTTIATGTIPLVDGQQDYDPPRNIHTLGENVYVVRTDVNPAQYRNLDVQPSLPKDLLKRTPYALRNISMEGGEGKLRLEFAPGILGSTITAPANSAVRSSNVVTVTMSNGLVAGCLINVANMGDSTMNTSSPTPLLTATSTAFSYASTGSNGTSGGGTITTLPWEIQGEYTVNPTKITATSQPCWFDDKYANVAYEGLLYWFFKLTNDARETAQEQKYELALQQMKQSEDLSNGEIKAFPTDPIGVATGQVSDGYWIWGA